MAVTEIQRAFVKLGVMWVGGESGGGGGRRRCRLRERGRESKEGSDGGGVRKRGGAVLEVL